MSVSNLPRVVAWQCTGQESNQGPLDLESDMLTTTPPSHPKVWLGGVVWLGVVSWY